VRYGLTAFLGAYPDPSGWAELAHRLGLEAIEVRAEPGFAHPEELGAADRRGLRRALAGLDVSLHAPDWTSPCMPPSMTSTWPA